MPTERKGISLWLHKYTNLWVEGLRKILPEKKIKMPRWTVNLFGWPDSAMTEGKDLGYIVGHVIVYGHIPVILAIILMLIF